LQFIIFLVFSFVSIVVIGFVIISFVVISIIKGKSSLTLLVDCGSDGGLLRV